MANSVNPNAKEEISWPVSKDEYELEGIIGKLWINNFVSKHVAKFFVHLS